MGAVSSLKEKTSVADLVTKYDRQVEDLVLARLRRVGNSDASSDFPGLKSYSN